MAKISDIMFIQEKKKRFLLFGCCLTMILSGITASVVIASKRYIFFKQQIQEQKPDNKKQIIKITDNIKQVKKQKPNKTINETITKDVKPQPNPTIPFFKNPKTNFSKQDFLEQAVYPFNGLLNQIKISSYQRDFLTAENYKDTKRSNEELKLDFIFLKKIVHDDLTPLLTSTYGISGYENLLTKSEYEIHNATTIDGISSLDYLFKQDQKVKNAVALYLKLEYDYIIFQVMDSLSNFYDNFKRQIQNLIGLFTQEIQQNKLNDYIEAIRLGYNIAFPLADGQIQNQIYFQFIAKPKQYTFDEYFLNQFTPEKMQRFKSQIAQIKNKQIRDDLNKKINRFHDINNARNYLKLSSITRFGVFWKDFMSWQEKALKKIEEQKWLSEQQSQANTAFLNMIRKKERFNII